MKKYFITFEGGDGAGKNKHILNIAECLQDPDWKPIGDKYATIWITREPTKITKEGKEISRLLKTNYFSGEKASELYISDRKQHSRIIEDQLKHSHVLSSRYDLSTLIYQYTQGIELEKLIELHKYKEKDGTLIPDLTIMYTIPLETAMKRINKRNEKEYFETNSFQEKLIKNRDYVIKEIKKIQPERKIIFIDTTRPYEEVIKEERKKVLEALVQ